LKDTRLHLSFWQSPHSLATGYLLGSSQRACWSEARDNPAPAPCSCGIHLRGRTESMCGGPNPEAQGHKKTQTHTLLPHCKKPINQCLLSSIMSRYQEKIIRQINKEKSNLKGLSKRQSQT
jgi:hypothetical protein